jgi:hypothetical protein
MKSMGYRTLKNSLKNFNEINGLQKPEKRLDFWL